METALCITAFFIAIIVTAAVRAVIERGRIQHWERDGRKGITLSDGRRIVTGYTQEP